MSRSVLASIALCGCVGNAALDQPSLDARMFAERVQPVLAARCASPTCHGSERRRLRVYATGLLRRDPSRAHRDEPIDADELRANERSAAAFALGVSSAAESLLVTKPRNAVNHLGARVFADSDADLEALLAWLRSGGSP